MGSRYKRLRTTSYTIKGVGFQRLLLHYFVAGVKLFEEPPVNVPPTLYTPPNRVSVAPETDVTPYINVWDVFVNSGDDSNTVALFTVLGHLYEKSTVPSLFFTAMYLPDVTDTDVTEE